MISANQIIWLSEEWFKNVPYHGTKTVPVYINPDSGDCKELYQSCKNNGNNSFLVRFIADAKQQKVWVWDGIVTIHGPILNSFNYQFTDNWVMTGYGRLKGSIIIFEDNEDTSRIENKITSLWSYTHWGNTEPEWIMKTFGKDIRQDVKELNDILHYNWQFIDKYLHGYAPLLLKLRQSYNLWMKEWGKKLL